MTIDTSKANISRIYDYVLGGHHNFEVDRAAAQQLIKVFPSYPRWARLNRWFLQMVADRWANSGYQHILDLGSGMPTQGHFHTVAPQSRVLYTDSDSMTAAYAAEVIGENKLVNYIQTDIRDPQPMLDTADELFEGDRRVAIGFIGVAYFIDDVSLAHLAQALHSWAAPGSVMALSFVEGTVTTDNNRQASDLFKRNGSEIFPRTVEGLRAMIAPWQITEVRPLSSWLEMDSLMEESDQESAGAQMYGALLEHKG